MRKQNTVFRLAPEQRRVKKARGRQSYQNFFTLVTERKLFLPSFPFPLQVVHHRNILRSQVIYHLEKLITCLVIGLFSDWRGRSCARREYVASVLEAVPRGPGEEGTFLGSKPRSVLQLLGNGLMSVGSGQYLYKCILYAMLNTMWSYPVDSFASIHTHIHTYTHTIIHSPL